MPAAGAQALADLDPEAAFMSDLTRRAARHLRDHLEAPAADIAEEDGELSTLMAELSVRAAEAPRSAHVLKRTSADLEIVRLDRAIAAARASGDVVSPLVVRKREVVKVRDLAIEAELAESHERSPS